MKKGKSDLQLGVAKLEINKVIGTSFTKEQKNEFLRKPPAPR